MKDFNEDSSFVSGFTRARICVSCLILLLFGFASSGAAQESRAEQVQVKYDEAKDTTTIVLNPFVLVSRRHEELRLSAVTSHKGKSRARPKEIALIFISFSSSNVSRYETARKLTVTADAQPFLLGETQYSKQSQKGVFIESMAAVVAFDTFLRIANAKVVTIKLGLTTLKLSSQHVTMLRAAVSYMSP
ncbi:MAG: hypothetical protein WKF74_15270 [Pyrinomonadaceae bacterium]